MISEPRPMKNNAKFTLSIILFSLCLTTNAFTQPIRDTFADQNVDDGDPIRWIGEPSTYSYLTPGLQLESSGGDAAIMEVDTSNSTGWSMRVLARQEEGDVTGLGVLSSQVAWVTMDPRGPLSVGVGGSTVLSSIDVDVDPKEEDFFLQFDTFDNELRAWAWPVGTVPSSQDPMVRASSSTLIDASPAFWVRDFAGGNGGLARSVFHWFEYSDEHIPIPVPEPTTDVLLLGSLAIALIFRNRGSI